MTPTLDNFSLRWRVAAEPNNPFPITRTSNMDDLWEKRVRGVRRGGVGTISGIALGPLPGRARGAALRRTGSRESPWRPARPDRGSFVATRSPTRRARSRRPYVARAD